MKIALLGYGKMGKVIEKIAISSGHEITVSIDNEKEWKDNSLLINTVDIAIDFSTPENILANIDECFQRNIPLVVGTTGWYNEMEVLKKRCNTSEKSFIWASNFSIGVNIFFRINQELAKLMNKYNSYDISLEEIHHTAKLDAPSGTAISLANDIIENIDRKSKWVLGNTESKEELQINSKRIDPIPGTHRIIYDSEIDNIEITHTANSRDGFAMGAVVAAEWLVDKKGWYEFKDVFFNKNKD